MSLVGLDGKPVNKVEGPFFWMNQKPDGTPDFTHVNILFKYGGKDYMTVLPMMEVKLSPATGEKEV